MQCFIHYICICCICIQIVGFIFGAITWMRKLVIGDDAPLRVIQDSVKLLGYVYIYHCYLDRYNSPLLLTCNSGY